jgi:hypothetical protein
MAEDKVYRPVERTEIYYTSEDIPDRPVERTGVSEHTGYTTYTVTEV